MRIRLSLNIILFTIFLGQTIAFSEEGTTQATEKENPHILPADEWTYMFKSGFKMWAAKWQTAFNTTGGADQTSNTTLLIGPNLVADLRFSRSDWFHTFGVNFTWLQASDFDMMNNSTSLEGESLSFERRDYSLVGTLSIWKNYGIVAGYYSLKQRPRLNGTRGLSAWFGGPVVGVFGSESLHKYIYVYGNLGYGFLKYDSTFRGKTGRGPVKGVQMYAMELGTDIYWTKYLPWEKTLTSEYLNLRFDSALQLGFRAQLLSAQFEEDKTTNDITWGPIIHLRFIVRSL